MDTESEVTTKRKDEQILRQAEIYTDTEVETNDRRSKEEREM